MLKNAKWIARDPWIEWRVPAEAEMPPAPYLVKDFEITAPPQKATLYVAGLGQAAYYVNGERIPDSYLPTYRSDFTKTVFYNTYEIAPLLRVGKNRLGAVLGNTAFNDPGVSAFRGHERMIASLELVWADGSRTCLVSDSSWKTHPSPTLRSNWRCGDEYDARLETAGWCDPATPTDTWQSAEVCRGPGGALVPSICPPMKVFATLPGKEIAPRVFDFGMNTAGWVRISVRGRAGSEVKLLYAELLAADGNAVDQRNINNCGTHIERYILRGDGEECWEQLFQFHGFRYVQLTGDCEILSVTALTVHTELKPLSTFSCDNDILSGVCHAAETSIRTCCHGAFQDCPHREQNEWTGDALLGAETICMAYDVYDLFYQWMQVFRDAQRPDGQLPCIVPAKQHVWEYNFANGIDWDSAIIHIPYYCMKYTGRREIVDLVWENMCKSMDFFASLSETCLMNNGLGDWTASEPCTKEITSTAMYRADALMMAEMARATGRDDTPFLTLADNIRRDFRAKYVKDGRLTERRQTALSVAIATGLLEEEECKAEAKSLAENLRESGNRFLSGVHGLRTVFSVLSRYGYADVLLDVLQNDRVPGYATALKRGHNTLWESFGGGTSHNHFFKCEPLAWLYRDLAGVHFEGLALDRIVIAPLSLRDVREWAVNVRGIAVSLKEGVFAVSSPYPFTWRRSGNEEHYPAGSYTFAE